MDSLFKQTQLQTLFEKIIANQRLAHAYLLNGASGSGKLQLANWLALRLFCQNLKDNQPCLTCGECQRILTHNHPDVIEIKPDGLSIKVDDIRLLKNEMAKSGMESSKRVFIIDQVQTLTPSAANSLLKFLEEPAANLYIILCTTNKSRVLQTITSRVQIVDMLPLTAEKKQANFADLTTNPQLLTFLAQISSDRQTAESLMTDDWLEQILGKLNNWALKMSQKQPEAFVLVQTQLMPLLNNRQKITAFLTLLNLMMQEMLHLHYQLPNQYFQNEQLATLQNWQQRLSETQLAKQLRLSLETQQKINQNISCQTTLESLTLMLLDL